MWLTEIWSAKLRQISKIYEMYDNWEFHALSDPNKWVLSSEKSEKFRDANLCCLISIVSSWTILIVINFSSKFSEHY